MVITPSMSFLTTSVMIIYVWRMFEMCNYNERSLTMRHIHVYLLWYSQRYFICKLSLTQDQIGPYIKGSPPRTPLSPPPPTHTHRDTQTHTNTHTDTHKHTQSHIIKSAALGNTDRHKGYQRSPVNSHDTSINNYVGRNKQSVVPFTNMV